MEKGLSQKIKSRIELLEGMNINDAIEKRYFVECLSYRKIAKKWNIVERTVAKIVLESGKEPRRGSEAVKTQWIDNTSRRIEASKKLAETNHNLAVNGLHVRQGKNKSNSELIRKISDKLKTSSSFNRRDVRMTAQANSAKTRRDNNHINNPFLKTPKTASEQLIADFLESKNVRYNFRFVINGYIVNFYLPDYNLVLDIQSSNRFPLSFKRHEAIQCQAFQVVYCIQGFVKKSDFSDLYNYISDLNCMRLNPTFRSEKTVIWGARNYFPFGKEFNQFPIEIIRNNISYKTIVTTTSKNKISSFN